MYYGPEFLGESFTSWPKNAGMAIQYIQPGKPNQNALTGPIGKNSSTSTCSCR